MKLNIRHIWQIGMIFGVCLLPSLSWAGSIQVMEPSTSKIEIFSTKGSGSVLYLGSSASSTIDVIGSHKVVKKSEPVAAIRLPDVVMMESAKTTLPVVPVNQIRKN